MRIGPTIAAAVLASAFCMSRAEAKPYGAAAPLTLSDDTSAPFTGQPSPTIAIQNPPDMEVIETDANDPVDSKAMRVKLAVKNWKVTPNGQGIVLVIDNKAALEIHDLSKPINLTDVFHDRIDPGWHFLAAFPVLANGYAVKTAGALAVSRFSYGKPDDARQPIKDQQSRPLLVVNMPMAGGFVREAKNLFDRGVQMSLRPQPALDLMLWSPPGTSTPANCVEHVQSDAMDPNGDGERAKRVKVPGVYAIDGVPASNGSLKLESLECPKFTRIWQVNDQNNMEWNELYIEYP